MSDTSPSVGFVPGKHWWETKSNSPFVLIELLFLGFDGCKLTGPREMSHDEAIILGTEQMFSLVLYIFFPECRCKSFA